MPNNPGHDGPPGRNAFAPGWDGPVRMRGEGGASRERWGNIVSIPIVGSESGIPIGGLQAIHDWRSIVDTPALDQELDFIVVLQLGAPLPNGGTAANTQAWVRITWWVGEAIFTKFVRIYPTVRYVPLGAARKVRLDGFWFTDSTTTSLEFRGGVTYGSATDARNDAGQWSAWVSGVNQGQIAGAASGTGQVQSNTGLLKMLAGGITAMSGAGPLYVMIFDSTNAPINGAVPIGGAAVGPFFAPVPIDGEDEADPGWFFSFGCWWSLSTTPGTLTLPAGGNVGSFAGKVAV